MDKHPFIFSDQLKYRLGRHTIFWVAWWVFCSIIYSYLPVFELQPLSIRFVISSTEALIFLPEHMFVAYCMVYFIVPRLLIRGCYSYSILAVCLLFLVTGILNAFLSPYVWQIRNFILDPLFGRLPMRYTPASFHYSIMAGLRGGITVGGLAATIK